ncbi:HU family DNA-binding protein [Bacteroidetes bacterium endosymbiont of Geopemphigus sp.]|uniref:HU family DNA-binding protein n=1 Tax=Bacteroidetes bacterium endosymbiont of Geopemphigus sp. TaxID=2047937 RepID=UPI000CD2F226|nr:HU family DNA-binding protein [Bacteroidetes bacterium endosymbiont of Geopemphigus sp.]
MNKTEMIEAIAKDIYGLSKEKINQVLASYVMQISECLEKGDKLAYPGLGTFSTQIRPARKGRNPQTGEAIAIPEKTVIKFKAAAEISNKVNHKNKK